MQHRAAGSSEGNLALLRQTCLLSAPGVLIWMELKLTHKQRDKASIVLKLARPAPQGERGYC